MTVVRTDNMTLTSGDTLVTLKQSLCVVPCGKNKVWDYNPNAGPTKAEHVYLGAFAKMCHDYARCFYCGHWVILSAKWGFLRPSDIVPEAYNVTFNKPKDPNIIRPEVLHAQALEMTRLRGITEVVVMAGKEYVERTADAFDFHREGSHLPVLRTPLAGLGGMGYMMGAMRKAIDSSTPL